jgi:hypothetical protein
VQRLCGLGLGQGHRQHSFVVGGLDLVRIIGIREREVARERAIAAFHAVEAAFAGPIFKFPLPAEDKRRVFDADVNVFQLHVGKIGFKHPFRFGFTDVHRRAPRPAFAGFVEETEGILKQTQAAGHIGENGGGCVTCNIHSQLIVLLFVN